MVSTKLCDLGSGVKHGKFTILFMFGIDPGGGGFGGTTTETWRAK